MTTRTLQLDADRFARLHGAQRLRVACGTLWLTIDGEPDDRVLERGDSLTLPPGAHALVQALDAPARAVLNPAPRWWERVARAWHAAAAPRAGVSA
jgi:quercetin dioxygenase-like cupin family protein